MKDGPRQQSVLSSICCLNIDQKNRIVWRDSRFVRRIEGNNVVTVAGNLNSQGDGPVSTAGFGSISGLALSSKGIIYVAEKSRIRKIENSKISTIAGNSQQQGHVDGPGKKARFASIRAIAYDEHQGLLIADKGYIRAYKNGNVQTIAGYREPGKTPIPVDGVALKAVISGARAFEVVGSAVYFSDIYLIRKLENGVVSTVAGTYVKGGGMVDGPVGKALFSDSVTSLAWRGGELFLVDRAPNRRIRKIANGVVSSVTNGKMGLKDGPLNTAMFHTMHSIVFGENGELYIADDGNCRIRRIDFK